MRGKRNGTVPGLRLSAGVLASEARVEEEGVRGMLVVASAAAEGSGLSRKMAGREGAGKRVGRPGSML
jgi:hypothetical protein